MLIISLRCETDLKFWCSDLRNKTSGNPYLFQLALHKKSNLSAHSYSWCMCVTCCMWPVYNLPSSFDPWHKCSLYNAAKLTLRTTAWRGSNQIVMSTKKQAASAKSYRVKQLQKRTLTNTVALKHTNTCYTSLVSAQTLIMAPFCLSGQSVAQPVRQKTARVKSKLLVAPLQCRWSWCFQQHIKMWLPWNRCAAVFRFSVHPAVWLEHDN